MAVIGSKTPNTEALVAPIFRVAMANEAVETIVGNIARPMRFPHADAPSKPAITSTSEETILQKKMTAPVSRA
jgi:hypothetical protein